MNQQRIFDEMIGTVPSSTVDVRGAIARQRRLHAVRRMSGVAAGVATLALAVGVGLTLSKPATETPSQPAAATTPAPESARQRIARINAAWEAAASTALPGAMYRQVTLPTEAPAMPSVDPVAYPEVPPVIEFGGALLAVGTVEFEGVEARFSFTSRLISSAPVPGKCETDCGSPPPCDAGMGCRSSRGPAGELIQITERTEPRPDSPPMVLLQVEIRSADNLRLVGMALINEIEGEPIVTAELPMTAEQVVTLLAAPALRI